MRKYLSANRASAIVERFGRARVLVIGDLIMDHFIWGRVRRISPEAPVPVVEVTSENLMLGGSANVINNIHSLGGKALVTGVVGVDNDGKRLRGIIAGMDIPTSGIVEDSGRPTTTKTRVIAHSQQVVRFDREKRDRIDPAVYKKISSYIAGAVRSCDVVVLSDYAKGLITEALVEQTRALCEKHSKPLLVDPKVEHFDYYRGATVVTPNNIEASTASGVDIEDEASLHRAGELLLNKLGCKALLVTRGEHGMSLFEGDTQTHIPTVAKEVYDVSGAGDTVIAVFALSLACGASFKEAAVLANYAAGVVVGKIGTATLTRAELTRAVADGLKNWPKNG